MNKVGRARAPNAMVLGADQTWTLPPPRFSVLLLSAFYLGNQASWKDLSVHLRNNSSAPPSPFRVWPLGAPSHSPTIPTSSPPYPRSSS